MSAVSVATPSHAAAGGAVAAEAVGAAPSDLQITVEFSGGLELLFSRVKRQQVRFPVSASSPASSYTMRFLIEWLKNHRCTERHELFVTEDSVRPGILVLINDTDWELEEGLEYVLRDGDTIVFISTLHGG